LPAYLTEQQLICLRDSAETTAIVGQMREVMSSSLCICISCSDVVSRIRTTTSISQQLPCCLSAASQLRSTLRTANAASQRHYIRQTVRVIET